MSRRRIVAGRGAAVRIDAGLNLGGDNSDVVVFDRVAPKAIKPAPEGTDQTALMLMGSGVLSAMAR